MQEEATSSSSYPGPPILKEEVEDAIRRLPKDKAAGFDNLPAELVQAAGHVTVSLLTRLCKKVIESGEWPKIG